MRSFGVEEEFLLVCSAGDRLVSQGDEIAGDADSATDDDQQVDHELKRAQVETGTAPTHSLADIEAQLRQLRAELSRRASRSGAVVAALGTWPFAGGSPTTQDDRYLAMTEQFGALARQQLTCGQHVHVGVEDLAEAVGVIDRIRGWLPLLRALATNSPFWQGEYSGYASYRSLLWGQWPTAGPTGIFGSPERYDEVVVELVASGAAIDKAMIYFDARASAKYSTVEIRVADVCSDVRDAVLVAALCRALVETAARWWRDGADPASASVELLRGAVWRSARYGVSDALTVPNGTIAAADALELLVSHLHPALDEAGDLAVVEEGIQRILTRGTGADLQRSSFARRGDLRDVVLDAAGLTAV